MGSDTPYALKKWLAMYPEPLVISFLGFRAQPDHVPFVISFLRYMGVVHGADGES